MVVLLKLCEGGGGGIWIKDASDVLYRAESLTQEPAQFSSIRESGHETQRWTGHRHALIAYLPRLTEQFAADRSFLVGLEFRIPGSLGVSKDGQSPCGSDSLPTGCQFGSKVVFGVYHSP